MRREHRYALAAAFVRDALHGRAAAHRTDPAALRLYRLFHHPVYKGLYMCVLMVNLSLALWEPPADSHGVYSFYPFLALEVLCLAVYAFDSYLEHGVFGSASFFGNQWVKTKLLCMSVIAADVLIALALGPHVTYYVRFSRVVRPAMVVARFRNIRKQVSSIVVSASRLGKIALLIVLHIVFFGFMGFIVFGDSLDLTADEAARCDRAQYVSPFASYVCRDYFGYLGEAMFNLFVLLTTVNFPDLMLPYIHDTLWSAVFFVVYLCIGLYFLMSLVLAVIYDNYKSLTGAKLRKKLWRRKEALRAAFETLTHGDAHAAIDYATWERLFFTLRPDLRALTIRHSLHIAQLVFDAIDEDGSGSISLDEFYLLAEFIQLDVQHEQQRLSRNVTRRWLVVVAACESLASHPSVQLFFDLAIFFSGLTILFVDDATAMSGDSEALVVIDTVAVVIFVLELLIKAVGFGWSVFWADVWNRADLVLVTAMIVGDALASVLGDDMDQYTAVVVVIRLIRVSRVSHVLKRHSLLMYTLAQIVPTLMRFLAILAAHFYVFAIIGMECFAGKLTEERTAGSPYAENDYLALNFDTLPNAFVTEFVLLVVNNWPVFSIGCSVATSDWARVYFVAFYCIGVVIILNVLVAFMLESFLSLYEDNELMAEGAQALWQNLLDTAAQRKAVNHACYAACTFTKPHNVNDVLLLSMLREDFKESKDAAVDMNRVFDSPVFSSVVAADSRRPASVGSPSSGPRSPPQSPRSNLERATGGSGAAARLLRDFDGGRHTSC